MELLISKNISIIKDNIRKISKSNIKVIAVTKNVSVENIRKSIKYGINIIGENKVQEARKKYEVLKNDIVFHMIGHLQTNKVKDAVEIFELIHSIDRVELVKKLDIEAKKQNKMVKGLIQINIAGEKSKYGIRAYEIIDFLQNIRAFNNVKIEGLMTIAPFVLYPEKTRIYFRKMKILFDKLKSHNFYNVSMKWLSMGMSNDYIIAVEEGSNMIRIGSAIYGKKG